MTHHDPTDGSPTSIDRVLDAVDAGLQRSPERSYGSPGEPGRCIRDCATPAAPGSEFCAPCRSYLLGDLDTDPAVAPALVDLTGLRRRVEEIFDGLSLNDLVAGEEVYLWVEDGELLTGAEAVERARLVGVELL